jgi:hypothetical protein
MRAHELCRVSDRGTQHLRHRARFRRPISPVALLDDSFDIAPFRSVFELTDALIRDLAIEHAGRCR